MHSPKPNESLEQLDFQVSTAAQNFSNSTVDGCSQFPVRPTHNNRFMVVKGLSCTLSVIFAVMLGQYKSGPKQSSL